MRTESGDFSGVEVATSFDSARPTAGILFGKSGHPLPVPSGHHEFPARPKSSIQGRQAGKGLLPGHQRPRWLPVCLLHAVLCDTCEVGSTLRDAREWQIEASLPDGTAVRITIVPTRPDATRVKIRVGMVGSQVESQGIQARISRILQAGQ